MSSDKSEKLVVTEESVEEEEGGRNLPDATEGEEYDRNLAEAKKGDRNPAPTPRLAEATEGEEDDGNLAEAKEGDRNPAPTPRLAEGGKQNDLTDEDYAAMREMRNLLYGMDGYEDGDEDGDEDEGEDGNLCETYFPTHGGCQCCGGYKLGCQCVWNGQEVCIFCLDIHALPPLPATSQDVKSIDNFWYPICRDCTCCKGYKGNCNCLSDHQSCQVCLASFASVPAPPSNPIGATSASVPAPPSRRGPPLGQLSAAADILTPDTQITEDNCNLLNVGDEVYQGKNKNNIRRIVRITPSNVFLLLPTGIEIRCKRSEMDLHTMPERLSPDTPIMEAREGEADADTVTLPPNTLITIDNIHLLPLGTFVNQGGSELQYIGHTGTNISLKMPANRGGATNSCNWDNLDLRTMPELREREDLAPGTRICEDNIHCLSPGDILGDGQNRVDRVFVRYNTLTGNIFLTKPDGGGIKIHIRASNLYTK